MFDEKILDEMVGAGDKIAVGVSGGADSMFLLYVLLKKKIDINFNIKVIHVNHHLRDLESERDKDFVKSFCEDNNIDYKIIDIDVKKLKEEKNKSIEEVARIARFESMYDEMKKNKIEKLFLAHHANDQAETILMHIFRGAGISGAMGIKSQNNKIFRPLLNMTRNEILEECNKLNIEYIVDSSNNDNSYTRNYIRNVVIPSVENKYPDVIKRICAFGDKCAEIQSFINESVNKNLIEEKKHFVLIKGDAFNNKNFIIREYIKIALEKLKIFSDFDAKHYSLIIELNKLPVNSQINLPQKIIAKKTYGGVKLYKKSSEKFFNSEIEFTLGTINVENFGKIKTEIISLSDVSYGDGNHYIDYFKISNNAVWRFRKPGDMFAKLGSGSKKLNDYFTDKKIDVDLRDFIPVLAYQNSIYIVTGYDISDMVKIDDETDKVLKISVEYD